MYNYSNGIVKLEFKFLKMAKRIHSKNVFFVKKFVLLKLALISYFKNKLFIIIVSFKRSHFKKKYYRGNSLSRDEFTLLMKNL